MCPRDLSLCRGCETSESPTTAQGFGRLIPAVEMAVRGLDLERARKVSLTLFPNKANYGALSNSAPGSESSFRMNQTTCFVKPISRKDGDESVLRKIVAQKRQIKSSSIEKHDYLDHSNDPLPVDSRDTHYTTRGGVTTPFPMRLYQLLENVEKVRMDDVCSWRPHGRAFCIHDSERFVKEIMPNYFRQTKLSSFQRQLNLYGFRRLTKGPDRNSFYHELFLRGRPHLCGDLHRHRIKGAKGRTAIDPDTEPNFYKMSPLHGDRESNQGHESASIALTPTYPKDKHGRRGEALEQTSSLSLSLQHNNNSTSLILEPCCHNSFSCGQRYTTLDCKSDTHIQRSQGIAAPNLATTASARKRTSTGAIYSVTTPNNTEPKWLVNTKNQTMWETQQNVPEMSQPTPFRQDDIFSVANFLCDAGFGSG